MELALQLIANGIVTGSLYALLSTAFGLVYRTTNIFHIAYGGQFVLSCYFYYTLAAKAEIPLIAAATASIGLSALLGWTIHSFFYRHLFKRECSSGAILVASLGLLIIIENLVALTFGNETKIIPRDPSKLIELGPINVSAIQATQAIICSTTLALLFISLRHSRLMKTILAIGDNPALFQSLKHSLNKHQALVFVISGSLIAIPAILITHDTGTNPHTGMHYLLLAAVGTLLGGKDKAFSWALGGFAIAIAHSLIIWQFSSEWSETGTFSILLIILLFRPSGIFGTRNRVEEI